MARDTLVEGSTLTAIADAIREKTETSDVMYPSEMAGKILSIETGESGTLVSEVSAIYTKDSLPEGQITSSMGDVEVVKFKPKYSGAITISATIKYSFKGPNYIKINNETLVYKNNSSSSGTYNVSEEYQVVKDTIYTLTVSTGASAKCTYTNFAIKSALSSPELLTII